MVKINEQSTGLTNTNAWEPVSPDLTNMEGQRSREAYDSVLDQFDVENNPRYSPRGGCTYCNIFVWDATRAMEAEIPHWIDCQSGAPRQFPQTHGAREADANVNAQWLREYGHLYGWVKVAAGEAQESANRGQPTVVALESPDGIGHIAMVRPAENAGEVYQDSRGVYRNVYIAQAGADNFNFKELAWGFLVRNMPHLEFYTHA